MQRQILGDTCMLGSDLVFSMPFLLAETAPSVEDTLLKVLIQLTLILVLSRIFAIVFRKLGQPAVVGETAAGLALGPSLFGHFCPELSKQIFDPSVDQVFKMFSQLGLILLLFLVGLEFDFSHLKKYGRSSLLISLAGIVLPFGLGWVLARHLHASLQLEVPLTGFALFMGTAMSITAIPVLARIMMELNITPTRLGAITITAAAVDDASGWIMLASVSAMVRSSFSLFNTAVMAAETIAFAGFVLIVLKPLLARLLRGAVQNGKLSVNWLAAIFALLFLCAIATNLIGIFAIFGTLWLAAGLVSACAIAGKFGGCTVAARVSGFSWRESSCIGAMMNTRGLMELVVINAGYELHVIPESVYCMLVLMAVTTTVMTVPVLLRIMKGTELEPWINKSSFVAKEAEVVPD